MKKTLFLSLLILFILLLTACGSTTPPTQTATNVADDFKFTLIAGGPPQYLTLADLKALPATEGMAGIMSSTGKISVPELYKGVAIKDLVAAYADGFDASMGVTLTAQDGYSMTYSFDQVMNGDFIAYDPALGSELGTHDPLTAILAYERNGLPLDPIQDGTLRMVVISEKNNQVTDGHWSIKWVNRMEVESVGVSWELDLDGATRTLVSRDSFQSCGSPGCHGVEVKDETGSTWTGVPLWVLVGEVDDADQHSDQAYNDALAESGYTVDVVAADGYTVTFESLNLKRNSDIVVAYLLNSSELPEKHYPLRLMGPGLETNQMVGAITQIAVHVPKVSDTELTSTVLGDLVLIGMVDLPQGLMEEDLRTAQELVQLSTEHPKDGLQDYEGIRFAELFAWAGLQTGSASVVLTGSDGYSAEIPLAELQACEPCMLAFTDTPGVFNTVMPGMSSKYWMKGIVSIEVK